MTSINETYWWCLHPDCLCITDFHNSQEELLKHTLEEHICDDETDDETEVGTYDETEVGTDDETEVGTYDETEVGTYDETEVGTDDETEVGTDDETEVGTDMSDGLSYIGEIWKEISCKIEYLDEIV